MKRVLRVLAIVLLVALGFFLVSQFERSEGYFSPVFSPDGRAVYFIRRETSGLILGLGWEGFTPPAQVFVWHDRFSLDRLDLETSKVRTVLSFPPSPLERTRIRTYRRSAFSSVSAGLRWAGAERLEFSISVTIPKQPMSEQHVVSRQWDREASRWIVRDRWEKGWPAVSTGDEAVVHGDLEVVDVPGERGFPCAIVLHEASTKRIRVLRQTRACERMYPDGVPEDVLRPMLRRPQVERIRRIESARKRLVEEAGAAGLSASDAEIQAINRMQELGYYSRPPQLVAAVLGPREIESLRARGGIQPLFRIEEMQFTVGLFPDIDAATRRPGTSVEKWSGAYIRHRDYTTSEELNAHLGTGASEFFVERGGRIYRVRIEPTRPATRP
jgi:hypothetical protein